MPAVLFALRSQLLAPPFVASIAPRAVKVLGAASLLATVVSSVALAATPAAVPAPPARPPAEASAATSSTSVAPTPPTAGSSSPAPTGAPPPEGGYPPGAYPPGAYPPGGYPPGGYPPGGYPPGAYPPRPTPPASRADSSSSTVGEQPSAVPEREDVEWFVRLEIGGGPAGFSQENSLLRQEGYGGGKLWVTIDGAYMAHRNLGVGLVAGMNRRRVAPEASPALEEVAFFVAAQAPILLVGSRDVALHLTPRLGYCAGSLDFDRTEEGLFQLVGDTTTPEDESGDYQHTAIVGGALSVQSFTYHVGGSVGLLMAPVGPPGETGRHHDYGGLYFTLGGTIDG